MLHYALPLSSLSRIFFLTHARHEHKELGPGDGSEHVPKLPRGNIQQLTFECIDWDTLQINGIQTPSQAPSPTATTSTVESSLGAQRRTLDRMLRTAS